MILLRARRLNDVRTAREDKVLAKLDAERRIHAIHCDRIDLDELVGAKGGGHLRVLLNERIHEERVKGTPLYLLLDDISGASLVSQWAWSRWADDWHGGTDADERRARMENICTGFATGSSALSAEFGPNNETPVVPLLNPEDPESWHPLPQVEGTAFRRARHIDVWLEGDLLQMDVGFQDSASDPQLERVAIHEYQLKAQADYATGALVNVEATPSVLPFPECPGAIKHIQRLVGTPLADMRQQVIDTLPGILGCTHLNDVLRSLAEAPVLAELLVVRVILPCI